MSLPTDPTNPWIGVAATSDSDVLTRRPPTDTELQEAYVPENSRPAQYPAGVIWYADYQTLDDGMCRHARLQARGLYDFGVAVKLQSINHTIRIGKARDHDPLLHVAPGNYHASEDLMTPDTRAIVAPLTRLTMTKPHLIVRQAPFATPRELLAHSIPRYATMDPKVAESILQRTIVYLPWERSTVSPDYVRALNRFAQVWLQSRRHIQIFADAGVDRSKLCHVPNAVDTKSPLALAAATRTIPSGKRFYNIGKWEPRKNQHKLLGAFLREFTPKSAASLFMKTHPFGSWANYPSPPESLEVWLSDPEVIRNGWTRDNYRSRVVVTDVTYSEADLQQIHLSNNIYVSAGAGEAWDYPAHDAKLAGNRLVYVGFGGPEDYAKPDDIQVPWTLEPVHPGYPWGANAQWAKYELSDLQHALRSAQLETPDPLHTVEGLAEFQHRLAGGMVEHLARALGLSVQEWRETGAWR